MFRFLFTSFLLCLNLTMFAQNGVVFRPLSFEQSLQVAKAEKKLIFVDCYTSWCGPCKMLAKKVFPTKEVGEVFNDRFICIKMDMEKGDGPRVAKRYKVGAYPTLLFIDGEGNLKHSIAGLQTPERLLEQAQVALSGKKSLSDYTAQYDAGERNESFVFEYLDVLYQSAQSKRQAEVATEYLSKLDDDHFFTRRTWDVLNKNLYDPLSPIVKKAFQAKYRFESFVGKDTVQTYFDYSLRSAVSSFVWHNPKKSPLNQKRYDELVNYLQSIDMPTVPQYLVKLYAVQLVEKGNLQGLVNEMKHAFRYGIFYNQEAKLGFFQEFIRHIIGSKDKDLMLEVDHLLEQAYLGTEIKYYQSKFSALREQLKKAVEGC